MARVVIDSADSAGTSQAKMQSKRPVSAGRHLILIWKQFLLKRIKKGNLGILKEMSFGVVFTVI